MTEKTPASTTAVVDRLLAERPTQRFVLRLYVTGMTQLSMMAVSNARSLCEEHLAGRFDLEVINLFDHPEMAEEKEIVAAPTLVKELPLPLRRLVGDLSDRERVIMVLQEGEPDPATREGCEETQA